MTIITTDLGVNVGTEEGKAALLDYLTNNTQEVYPGLTLSIYYTKTAFTDRAIALVCKGGLLYNLVEYKELPVITLKVRLSRTPDEEVCGRVLYSSTEFEDTYNQLILELCGFDKFELHYKLPVSARSVFNNPLITNALVDKSTAEVYSSFNNYRPYKVLDQGALTYLPENNNNVESLCVHLKLLESLKKF